MGYTKRECDNCGKEYKADNRNLKRGWGLCCSKSCAAKKREKSKPTYNAERVKRNNIRRENWNVLNNDLYVFGISGQVSSHTSEGYKVIDGIAYNEWSEAVYVVDPNEDDLGHGLD